MESDEEIDEDHIEQVIDCSDLRNPSGEQSSSDDEDQQSTSNISEGGAREVIDDSLCALQAHEQDCFAIAIVAERWLASGGEDDVAFLWDQHVSDSDPVLKIEHGDSVTHVGFNNAQTLLATADMSGKIVVTQLCDLNTRAKINECNDLEWMCWHTTSDILFAGDKDGLVWMWLIGPSGVAQSKVYSGNGSSCADGILLPDGRRLLAGYADGSVRLWNLKDGTFTMTSVNWAVSCMHHHISQPIAAVGMENGSVVLVSTAHADKISQILTYTALSPSENTAEEDDTMKTCVECVQFAPFSSWLAVGRNDGTFSIYDTVSTTPRSIYRNPSPQAIVRALWCIEGNTPFVCVGSVDGFVRIFDARDGSLHKELGNGGDDVLDMAILGSNPLRIISAGGGGVIRIFDLSCT